MPAASIGVSTSSPAVATGNDTPHINGGTDGLGTSGKVIFPKLPDFELAGKDSFGLRTARLSLSLLHCAI